MQLKRKIFLIYVFDIDGTICQKFCELDGNDYRESKPFFDRIEKNNLLYESGNTVIYCTARGMGRTDNNVIESYKLFYDFTKQQLDEWGVKYHDLFLGKPSGDIYVDDKGENDKEFYRN
jgi:hypothetical protein